MEIRFFWVADQVNMGNFDVQWHPGQENLADYFTKHFVGMHHREVRLWYLHEKNSPRYLPRAAAPSTLRGCVGTLANGYIKSVPLPRVTARAAHVTAVTARRQALTPVPYGLAPVPLSSPMTEHRFSHESESFVQPLIMRQVACHTSSQYLPRIQHTVLIN